MSGWLVDTNVVSELRRPSANRAVLGFLNSQPGGTLFASDILFAEIRYGAEVAGSASQRIAISEWLEATLRPFFHQRILGITQDVLVRWKFLLEDARRARRTNTEPDTLIAAHALAAGLIVVSRDTKPFTQANTPVFDPWTWEFHAQGRVTPVGSGEGADCLARVTQMLRDSKV